MKKLVVSEDICISCGACIQIDEEHFDFASNGISTVKTQKNLDSEALHQAIDTCPVAAIKLEESDNIKSANEESSSNEESTTQEEITNSSEECNCDNSTKCENCACHNEQV